jgi:hypothetical protein
VRDGFLTQERERLAWVAVAAMTIILGLGAVAILQPWTRYFLDWRSVLQAGSTWAAGGNRTRCPATSTRRR